MARSPIDFFERLPAKVGDWKKTGPAATYDQKGLFQYIDGGAELFLSYSFQSLTAFRYLRGTDEEIKVDLFDMGEASNAFGVFAHGRESISQQVGQGSEYTASLLTFWKDRYYVSILAYPETDERREVVFALGKAIARIIPRDGKIPDLVAMLPASGLIPETVRFFHHHSWLNTRYYVSDENLLHLDPKTDAALGRYTNAVDKHFLLLIKYPNEGKAKEAHSSFLGNYLAGSVDGLGQQEGNRWAGLKRSANLIVVVLDAASESIAREALALVGPPRRASKPNPGPGSKSPSTEPRRSMEVP